MTSDEALSVHDVGRCMRGYLEKIHSPDAFECFAKICMTDGNEKKLYPVSRDSYSVEFDANNPMD